MPGHSQSQYHRGTIEIFDDRFGNGVIIADESEGINDQLRFTRRSLRRHDSRYQRGDRVLFRLSDRDGSTIIDDVHEEVEETFQGATSAEPARGLVKFYDATREFGFIRLSNGRDVYFNRSSLIHQNQLPLPGDSVTCFVVATAKGRAARNISIDTALRPEPDETWLARAVIAKDSKRFDEAARLYERGMRESPTLHLVLSYASMERMRNRRDAAMRVYSEGIKRLPTSAKLREDAGVLAATLEDYESAVRLLKESLDLIRRHGQGGEKGVLLELARTNYKIGKESSLKESVRLYEEAQRLFAREKRTISTYHELLYTLAKIRLKHHRGQVAVSFLSSPGFEIVRAKLLEANADAAEFVVRVESPEFKESYGLGEHLLVRCMFKTSVSLDDLNSLNAATQQWAESGMGDGQVALLIVSSLSVALQGVLARRIEERGESTVAIVPLQQTEMETGTDPAESLRAVLNRWLYRRDLFAGNEAVQGSRFFGRTRQLAEMRDAILSGTSLGIFGLRKVGKTSLLLETQRRAAELGDIVLYIDLQRTPTDAGGCRWLYWRLCEDLRRESERRGVRGVEWELAGRYPSFLKVPDTFPIATGFDSDLTALLRRVSDGHTLPMPRVVLLFDEIESILPHSSGRPGLKGYVEFLAHLRGIAQEHKHFVFMVTAANPSVSEAAQFESRDNPVFNFFRETYLQLLQQQECATMMRDLGRGMGIRFTADAFEQVFRMTGGHPYFARQLCSFAADRIQERPATISGDSLSGLESTYMDERGAKDVAEILERLQRDYPAELDVCVRLAVAGGSMPTSQLREQLKGSGGSTLRHLTGYQIAKIENESVHLTMGLMSRWLRSKYA